MRTLPALAATLISGAACLRGTAWADEAAANLPDIVVTATRTPTPLQDIPAGVTVITREDIQAHGYNTLAEALTEVPGVSVSQSGGPGGEASVFIRGTNSYHVLVLRDGMPINDAADTNDAFNFGTITVGDVERIEIIRGPMASLYGSGAIGGVINLISRRGTEPGLHWSGDLAGGYPALLRGTLTASGIEGPIDFALTAESQSDQGYDTNPQRIVTHADLAQGFRDRTLTMNLGYTPVDGTRLSLFARANVAYIAYDALQPAYDLSLSEESAASLLGRIGGTTHLFDGRLETSLFVGQMQDDRSFIEPLAAEDPNQTTSDSRYHSYRTDVQWNNTLHLDDLVPVPQLSLSTMTFGFENTDDTAKVRINDSFAGFPYGQSTLASMTTNAAYVGLQTTLLQRLALTGQVRQDWVENNTPTTWRLGGVYDLPELATHFKLAYGTGFRTPSLFERYGVDTEGFVGNPLLKPEESQGWETGFTTDITAWGRNDFATVGATYFDERVRDLIVGVFTPVDTEINLGSAHMHGVETEATLHPTAWLDVHATYTLLNTASDEQPAGLPTQLLRRPQNEASIDITVRPLPALRMTAWLIYTGPAYDYLYDNTGNGIGYGVGQHGLVANVTVRYAVTRQVELYLNGYNIFDSKFEPVNGFQVPGPTVLAGVRVAL